jgi:hypothetical protein
MSSQLLRYNKLLLAKANISERLNCFSFLFLLRLLLSIILFNVMSKMLASWIEKELKILEFQKSDEFVLYVFSKKAFGLSTNSLKGQEIFILFNN